MLVADKPGWWLTSSRQSSVIICPVLSACLSKFPSSIPNAKRVDLFTFLRWSRDKITIKSGEIPVHLAKEYGKYGKTLSDAYGRVPQMENWRHQTTAHYFMTTISFSSATEEMSFWQLRSQNKKCFLDPSTPSSTVLCSLGPSAHFAFF